MPKIRRIPELPPLPSELHSRLHYLHGLTEQLQREITEVRAQYAQLNPEHVTADHFGAPLTRDEALERIRTELVNAQIGVGQARNGLTGAQAPAARLYTSAAGGRWREAVSAQHEQAAERDQLPAPHRGIERSR